MFKDLSSKITERKGFTLVELMIVIAIIAILMLVLIPRIGILKTKSKEAGIRANALMVEGLIRNEIENYTITDPDPANFAARLIADIDAPADLTDQIRNPISGITGAEALGAAGAITPCAVVVVTPDATPTLVEYTGIIDAVGTTGEEGCIAVGIYANGAVLTAQIFAYDETGTKIDNLSKTISK